MNFVAIDFETANEKRNSACSLGIIVVRNNKIIEKKYYLIKPCEERFSPMNIWIHGITEEDVKEEKTFKELWKEIRHYFEGNFIVAHNAAFDISVLRKTLDFYSIEYPNFQYGCTVVMSRNYYIGLPNYKLNTVNDALGFKFEHHNALEDAIASANIVMNICKDLNISTVEELSNIIGIKIGKVFNGGYKSSGTLGKSKANKKLFPYISNNLNYKSELFKDKVVAFTGPLKSMSRDEAIKIVSTMGGVIGSSVTKKTNYIITGIRNIEELDYNNKSGKIKKAESLMKNGQKIDIIYEEIFLELIRG